jgi:monoamine oxidase
MRRYETDLCVIGGGVAGLTAAGHLAAHGKAALLVEGRNRLGGRIETSFAGALPVELGAEFVHGRHPGLHGFTEQNHLDLAEMEGIPYRDSGRGLKPVREDDDAAGEVLSSPDLALNDEPFSTFLERSGLDEASRARVKSFVEGFNAADSGRISTRALFHQQMAEQKIEGVRAWRLSGGYVKVVNALAARIPPKVEIFLSTVVKRIVWRRGQVRIEARQPDGERLEIVARGAIVTAPLGVLLGSDVESRIEFSPEPEQLRHLNLLAPGAAVRINLVFREPLWERAAPNGGFLLSQQPHFPTWWPRSAGSAYLLTGWCGGPNASTLPVTSRDEVLGLALAVLANLLHTSAGDLRLKCESVHFHDWMSDPFSRCAYSYVRAGGFAFSQTVSSGIESTLWLAGEAMACDGYWGTVHGAMESGQRAADEFLRVSP